MKKIRRYGNTVWDFKDKKIYEVVEWNPGKPRNTRTANCYECDVIYVRNQMIIGIPNAKLFIEVGYDGKPSIIDMPKSVQMLEDNSELHMAMKEVQLQLYDLRRVHRNLKSAREKVDLILRKCKEEQDAL